VTQGAILAIGVLIVLALWILGAYNRVIGLRGAIVTAWDAISPVLGQRADAVRQLVALLCEHLVDERGSCDAALAAQAELDLAVDAASRRRLGGLPVEPVVAADAALAGMLTRLHSLGEQLAGSAEAATTEIPIRAALTQLAVVAARLRFERGRFNEAAAAYNAAIGQFPTRLLAPMFRFEPAARW
jgi:LemA protein